MMRWRSDADRAVKRHRSSRGAPLLPRARRGPRGRGRRTQRRVARSSTVGLVAAVCCVFVVIVAAVPQSGLWSSEGDPGPAGAVPAVTGASRPPSDIGAANGRTSPSETASSSPRSLGPSPVVAAVPQTATGRFEIASLQGGVVSRDAPGGRGPDRRVVHYTVEVEVGLPVEVDPAAAAIDAVLGDGRGWSAVREVDFERVVQDADIRIVVASPDTTDRLCAPLRTGGEVSCRNGDLVVLNARRWAGGIPDYEGYLADYRRYLVNHEVGHALGEPHVICPSPGEPAPVMQQQTYGLDRCVRNPWPSVG